MMVGCLFACVLFVRVVASLVDRVCVCLFVIVLLFGCSCSFDCVVACVFGCLLGCLLVR